MIGPLHHISPRTKILFLAAFLILLPGALLSYLGFRSVSERAESLATTYRGSVILVRDKIESDIAGQQETFRSAVIDRPPNSASASDAQQWLKTLRAKYPGFKDGFLVNAQRGAACTIVSMGWTRSENDPDQAAILAMREVQSAERMEFVDRNVAVAVQFYTQALAKAGTYRQRDILMMRIGRCYFKMKQYKTGIAEYQKIRTVPASELNATHAPASVIALSQIVEGYRSMGRSTEQASALVTLYERLLLSPWDLSGGDYLYYLRSTIAEIDSLVHQTSTAERVKDRVAQLREREVTVLQQCDFVQSLHQTVAPQVLSQMSRDLASESPFQQMALTADGTVIELKYLRLAGPFQALNIVGIGYALDEQYFVSATLPRVLGTVDLGKDLVVGILNADGVPRYLQKEVPSSTFLVAEEFAKTFPRWKVVLFHSEGKTVEALVGREKNLYLVLFLAIVAVMIVGIVVIGRAALHELEAARMKSEFVSSVSHELKTPLALIRMFGETLESGIVSDEERRQEFYRIITKESERLTHLINNVLDFSKMETGNKRYHFEADDIIGVARSTLEAYRFHIRDLGFVLITELPDVPMIMKIDKDAISQALLNLLNNAVKYSDDRKAIRVDVSTNAEDVLVSVEDQGVGIPADEIKKIFENFYRATTTRTRETTGSGLGLPLVKHIVEAHGGSVEVRSTLGEGSVFVMKLPRRDT